MKYRIARAAGHNAWYWIDYKYWWWPFWIGVRGFEKLEDAEESLLKQITAPKKQVIKEYTVGKGWKPPK